MGEISFAKLDALPSLPLGHIYHQKDRKDMFRVIGPNNEVERFHGNFLERKEVLDRWKTSYITQSRFAHLVEWPEFEEPSPDCGVCGSSNCTCDL